MSEQHSIPKYYSYLNSTVMAGSWMPKKYCRQRTSPAPYLQRSKYMLSFNCWVKHGSLHTDTSSGEKEEIAAASVFPLSFFVIGTLEVCRENSIEAEQYSYYWKRQKTERKLTNRELLCWTPVMPLAHNAALVRTFTCSVPQPLFSKSGKVKTNGKGIWKL